MADLTWNPMDKGASFVLSNGNLTATTNAATSNVCRATVGKSSGKWYYTVTLGGVTGAMIGVARSTPAVYSATSGIVIYTTNGKKYASSAAYNGVAYTSAFFAVGKVIDVAVDLDAWSLTYYNDGSNLGGFSFGLADTGLIYPYIANPGVSGWSCTLTPSVGKIAGYSWWDGAVAVFSKKRPVYHVVSNYGIVNSVNK